MKLFGYEIKKKSAFYPIGANYSQQDILSIYNRTADWLGLDHPKKQLRAYETIPDVRNLIEKLGTKLLRAIPKHYKLVGGKWDDISETSHLIKSFRNPNPGQDGDEFLLQLFTYWQVFGNNMINVISKGGVGFEGDYNRIQALYNVPFQETEIRLPNYFGDIDNKQIAAQNFTVNLGGNSKKLNWSDIIHINDVSIRWDTLTGYFIGTSKLKTLDHAISNLGIGYEAKNVLWKNRGAMGMITPDAGGGDFKFPFLEKEQKALQDAWQKYGISKGDWQFVLSKTPLKYTQISTGIKDLMLYDGITDDRKLLTAGYELPFLLYFQDDSGTFSNFDRAEENVYQDKIIPDSKRIALSISNYFNLNERNERFAFDFSDVEVLQDDLKTKYEKNKIQSDGISLVVSQFNTGQLTEDQATYLLTNSWEVEQDNIEMLLTKPEVEEVEETETPNTEDNETQAE